MRITKRRAKKRALVSVFIGLTASLVLVFASSLNANATYWADQCASGTGYTASLTSGTSTCTVKFTQTVSGYTIPSVAKNIKFLVVGGGGGGGGGRGGGGGGGGVAQGQFGVNDSTYGDASSVSQADVLGKSLDITVGSGAPGGASSGERGGAGGASKISLHSDANTIYVEGYGGGGGGYHKANDFGACMGGAGDKPVSGPKLVSTGSGAGAAMNYAAVKCIAETWTAVPSGSVTLKAGNYGGESFRNSDNVINDTHRFSGGGAGAGGIGAGYTGTSATWDSSKKPNGGEGVTSAILSGTFGSGAGGADAKTAGDTERGYYTAGGGMGGTNAGNGECVNTYDNSVSGVHTLQNVSSGTANFGGGGGGGVGAGGSGGSGVVALQFSLKPTLTISGTNTSTAYTGNPIAYSVSNLVTGSGELKDGHLIASASISYQGSGSTVYNYTSTPPTNAGTYLVFISNVYVTPDVYDNRVQASDFYTVSYSNAIMTITKNTASIIGYTADYIKGAGDADTTITDPSTSPSGGTYVYASSDPTVVSVSGKKLSYLKAGTATISAVFTPNDTANWFASSSQNLFTVTVKDRFTVTFMKEDATTTAFTSSVLRGENLTIPAGPSDTGTFVGWYDSSSGGTRYRAYDVVPSVQSALTFYERRVRAPSVQMSVKVGSRATETFTQSVTRGLTVGQAAVMTASATSPDTGSLTYAWGYSNQVSQVFSSGSLGNSTTSATQSPSAAGTYSYTVTVTNTVDGVTATKQLTFTATVSTALSFSSFFKYVDGTTRTSSLIHKDKDGVVIPSGTALTTGGLAPITFNWTGNPIPGITFDTSTGKFSGSPTASGTYGGEVWATDANGFSRPSYEICTIFAGVNGACRTQSVEVTVVKAKLDVPSAPTVVVDSPTSMVVTLHGTVADAASYTVTATPSSGTTENFTNFVSGSQITGLAADTTYDITVTAVPSNSEYLESNPSTAATATTYKWFYTTTYDANGGTFTGGATTSTADQYWDPSSTIVMLTGSDLPARAGYVFTGWATTSTGQRANIDSDYVFSPPSTPANTTYYAVWGPKPTALTVKTTDNAGTYTTTNASNGNYADSVDVYFTEHSGAFLYLEGLGTGSGTLSYLFEKKLATDSSYSTVAEDSSFTSLSKHGIRLAALAPTTTTPHKLLFTLTNTDLYTPSTGATRTILVNIYVAAAQTLSYSFPTFLEKNSAVTYSVTRTGGKSGYTYAVASGSLPAGLSLNASTGQITGTPTTLGSNSFTVSSTDANGDVVSTSSISAPVKTTLVASAPTSVTRASDTTLTVNFPAVTNAASYIVRVYDAANGGTQVGTDWISFAAGTNNTITGLTQNSTYYVGVTAVGSGNYVSSAESARVSATTYKTNYNVTWDTLGGSSVSSTTYAWNGSITKPASNPTRAGYEFEGWGLATNTTYGARLFTSGSTYTPPSVGDITIYAIWSDYAALDYTYTITGKSAVTVNATATSNTIRVSVPRGVSISFSTSASVQRGGTITYGWGYSSDGGAYSQTGTNSTFSISNIPAGGLIVDLDVKNSDAYSPLGLIKTVRMEIVSAADLTLSYPSTSSGEVTKALIVNATQGGGASPFTYAVASGALPAGLTLNTSSGQINGNPTAVESQVISIKVTDANGTVTTSSPFTITSTLIARTLTFNAAYTTKTIGQTQQLIFATLNPNGVSSTGTFSFSAGASTACTVNNSGLVTITHGTGTCAITESLSQSGNYAAATTATPATIPVGLAAQSITVATGDTTYGTNPALASSGSTGIGAVTYTKVSGPCAISDTVLRTTGAGNCVITATIAADTDYASATSAQKTIVIAPKPITVSANVSTASVVYGSTLPTLSYSTVAGALVGTDHISSVGYKYSAADYPSSATAPTNVGTYTVTPWNAWFNSGYATDYSITYATANFDITALQISTPTAPTVTTVSNTALDVTFSAVTNATGYVVRLYNASTGGTQVGSDYTGFVAGSANHITGLTAGSSYYASVQALGTGNYSNSLESSRTQKSTYQNTYTVTFNTQGGSTIASTTYAWNGSITKPASNPSRSGYNFSGWGTGATSTYVSRLFQGGATTFTPSTPADTTLYAIWGAYPTAAAVNYSVTGGASGDVIAGSTLNGGSYSQTIDLTSGQTLTLTPSATMGNGGSKYYQYSDSSLIMGGASWSANTSNKTATITAAAGTYSVQVGVSNNDSYSNNNGAQIAFTFTIRVAPALAVTTTNQTGTYNTAFTYTPTVSGGRTSYIYSATGLPSWATIGATDGVIRGTPTSAGTTSGITVTATEANGTSATSSTFSITIGKADVTLGTFAAVSKVRGDASFTPTTPSTGGVSGTWSYSSSDTSVISFSGTTASVGVVGSSTITATFTPDSTTNFNTPTAITFTATVSAAARTISVDNSTATYGTTASLTSTASAGTGTKTYSKVSGPCTLTGDQLTPTGAGTCVVNVSIATDGTYASASSVDRSISILAKPLNVSVTLSSSSIVYGSATPTITLNPGALVGTDAIASATYRFTGSWSHNSTVAPVTVGSYNVTPESAVFSSGSANNYDITYVAAQYSITKATPVVTQPANVNKTYGDSDFAALIPASNPSAGIWTYASSSDAVVRVTGTTLSVLRAGTATITATFTPTDWTNYNSTTTTYDVIVGKATPSFSASNVNKTYGDSAFTLTAPTTSLTGTWTYTRASGTSITLSGSTATVAAAGTTTITATFTPSGADSNNYSTGSVNFDVVVAKLPWGTPTLSSPSNTDTSITFTIGAVSGVSNYKISLWDSATSGVTRTVDRTVTSAGIASAQTITSLLPNTAYYVEVLALSDTNHANSPGGTRLLITTYKSTYTISWISQGTVIATTTYAWNASSVSATTASVARTGYKFSAWGPTPTATYAERSYVFKPSTPQDISYYAIWGAFPTSASVQYSIANTSRSGTVSATQPINGGTKTASLAMTAGQTVDMTATQAFGNGGQAGYSWYWTLPGSTQVTRSSTISSDSITIPSDVVGSVTIFVTIRNADAYSTQQTNVGFNFTVTVSSALSASMADQSATFGNSFTGNTPTVVGGSSGYTYAATGLPSWASISSTSGVIRGTPNSVGTTTGVTITATDANGATATTAPFSIVVGKGDVTLGSFQAISKIRGDASFTPSTPSTGGVAGTWSYSSSNTSVMSFSGTTATVGAVGTTTITATFTPSDTNTYNIPTAITTTATVAAASQTISVTPKTATYGSDTTLTTTGESGTGSKTFSLVSGPCTLNGSTLHPTAIGTCVVNVTIASDTNYASATSADLSITVNAASRTLAFATTSYSKTYGSTQTVTATPSVGSGTITYSAGASDACSVNALTGVVTITAASGTCSVSATITASGNYTSASTTTPATITVGKETPTFSAFSNLSTDMATALTLVGQTASLTGGTWSYSSSNTSVVSINSATASPAGVGTATITATYTPSLLDQSNYSSASGTFTITVTAATLQTPSAPTVTAGANGIVMNATWYTVSHASGYLVTLYPNGSITPIGTTQVGSGTNSASFSSVDYPVMTYSTTYRVTVKAIGDGTNFLDSAESTFGSAQSIVATAEPTYTVLSNVITTYPGTATFNAAAVSPDNGDLSYVWQYQLPGVSSTWSPVTSSPSGFNVSGRTSATLSLSNISTSISGYKFRVVITNTKNSNTATISTTAASVTVNKQTPTFGTINTVNVIRGAASQSITSPTAKDSMNADVTGSWSYTSSDTNVATISNTNLLNFATPGTATITATFTPGDSANFNGGTTTFTVNVAKTAQTISVSTTSAVYRSDTTLTTSGTTGSGAISYTKVSGPCTITGDQLHPTGAGTCVVNASIATDTNYAAATSANQSINIAKANRVISFGATTSYSKYYGQTQTVTATTADGTGAITYSHGNSTACTVDAQTGVVTITAASGTCSITATIAADNDYNSATTSTPVTFNVSKRPLTLTGHVSTSSVAYNTAIPTNSYTISSGSVAGTDILASVTYIYTGINNYNSNAPPANTGTWTVTPSAAVFSSGQADNYDITYVAASFDIVKADQTVSIGIIGAQTMTAGSVITQYSATSGLHVTVTTTTPAKCSVGSDNVIYIIAVGTCTIEANQSGNGNWNAAPVATKSFTIVPDGQVITFASLADKTFGDTAFTLSATSNSNLTVTFASATTSVCTVSGSTVTILAAGTCTINADQAGNATYSPATRVTRSFTVANAAVSNPSILSAVATAGVLKSISVSWTSVSHISGYVLRLYPASGTTSVADIAVSGSTSRVITASDYAQLADGTDYRVSISAIGAVNYSDSSESAKSSLTTNSAYTITYKSNGSTAGSAPAAGTYITGAAATVIATNSGNLVRTGYTFAGWNTLAAGTGTNYTANGTGTFANTENIDLYPVWTPNQITITFNANYGTTPSTSTQVFTADASAGLAFNAFNRAGYMFDGWALTSTGAVAYTDGASFSTIVPLTLYAKWTARDYTVTYQTNGGTGTAPTENTKHINDVLTVKAVGGINKTGYDFVGWSDGSNIYAAGDSYTMPAGNVIFTAQWRVQVYTITYDTNHATSGSPASTSDTFTYGYPAMSLTTPGSMLRTGYSFAGWSVVADGTPISGNYTPTSSITLYAVWSANTYTITYNSNGAGGTLAQVSDQYTTGGTAVTLPGAGTLAKTGYTFGGWSSSASGGAISGTYTTADDVTLYARWVAINYTITYNANGGATTPTESSKNIGDSFNLAAGPTKANYHFAGWSDGNSTYSEGYRYTVGSSDLTFTAVWVRVYWIHYNFNGANETAPADLRKLDQDSYTTSDAVTRAGYTFAGWKATGSNGANSQNAGLIAAGDTFTVDIDHYILSAQWNAIDYHVTYSSVGGVGVPTQADKNIGQTFSVGSAPTRAGYTFDGWSDGNLIYGPGATYSVGTSNIAFTAQWTAIEYDVTYNLSSGTSTPPVQAARIVDQTFVVAARPTRYGYTFDKWSDGTKDYQPGDNFTMPAHDVTLTAQWSRTLLSVAYDLNGGTSNTPTESNKGIGDIFGLAAAATWINHTFLGWFDGTNTYAAGSNYTASGENINFVARWINNLFTAIFNPGGATGNGPANIDKEAGSAFTMPGYGAFAKDGYSFSGWTDGAQAYAIGDTAVMTVGGKEFTATWLQNPTPAPPSSGGGGGGGGSSGGGGGGGGPVPPSGGGGSGGGTSGGGSGGGATGGGSSGTPSNATAIVYGSKKKLAAPAAVGTPIKWTATGSTCKVDTKGVLSTVSVGNCTVTAVYKSTLRIARVYKYVVKPRLKISLKSISNLKPTSARLNAVVAWPGTDFQAKFCVATAITSTDCKFISSISVSNENTSVSKSAVTVARDIQGLTPGTTYYIHAAVIVNEQQYQTATQLLRTPAKAAPAPIVTAKPAPVVKSSSTTFQFANNVVSLQESQTNAILESITLWKKSGYKTVTVSSAFKRDFNNYFVVARLQAIANFIKAQNAGVTVNLVFPKETSGRLIGDVPDSERAIFLNAR